MLTLPKSYILEVEKLRFEDCVSVYVRAVLLVTSSSPLGPYRPRALTLPELQRELCPHPSFQVIYMTQIIYGHIVYGHIIYGHNI